MSFKKLKFNIVNTLDITILIVAAAVLVSTFFKINNKQIFMLFDRTKEATVTVSANFENIDSENFRIGEKIYFSDTDETAGTIVSVRDIKEKKYTAINNSLMLDYSDKNVGVQIEIKAKIKENQSKKYINSSVFAARGSKFNLYTADVASFECTVDDILVTET